MFLTRFFQNDVTSVAIPGVYSNIDCRVLYSAIRVIRPKRLAEMSPGKGRTTSCIANALKDNGDEVEYFIFEKDPELLKKACDYLVNFPNIKVQPGSNVISDPLIDTMHDLDFLMVDMNHDYLLARYYLDRILPKVRNEGLVHIHDIYYDRNQKGWDDIGFDFYERTPNYKHPDLYSNDRLIELYGSELDKYKDNGPVSRLEEDEVKDYIIKNGIEIFSTKKMAHDLSIPDEALDEMPACCSIYFNHNSSHHTHHHTETHSQEQSNDHNQSRSESQSP